MPSFLFYRNDESESQRGKVTCRRSHRYEVTNLRLKYQLSDSRARALNHEAILTIISFVTIFSKIFHALANTCFMWEGEGKTFFKKDQVLKFQRV